MREPPDFRERRQREVPRIFLPRTSVNKGCEERGRDVKIVPTLLYPLTNSELHKVGLWTILAIRIAHKSLRTD